jgi:DNA polymerase (family 10)
VDNNTIADLLEELSALRVIDGSDEFRVRALVRAAAVVRRQKRFVGSFNPTILDGIGASIALKIRTIVNTGSLPELEELRVRFPSSALTMTKVPGVGPKTAYKLMSEYGVRDYDELVKANTDGRIENKRLSQAITFSTQERQHTRRDDAVRVLQPLLDKIRVISGVLNAEFAGSVRRGKLWVRDVDIIVSMPSLADTDIIEHVRTLFRRAGKIDSSGPKKDRILVRLNDSHWIQVDLLFVAAKTYGAALNYFTGSMEHNKILRGMAKSRGLTVNEYGIWRGKKRLGGEREEDLYEILGLPYHPPKLREGGFIYTAEQIAEFRPKIPGPKKRVVK